MKQILLLTFCFLAFSATALAQASETSETFDIATFKPPKGWEKQPSEGFSSIFDRRQEEWGLLRDYPDKISSRSRKFQRKFRSCLENSR